MAGLNGSENGWQDQKRLAVRLAVSAPFPLICGEGFGSITLVEFLNCFENLMRRIRQFRPRTEV